MNATHSRFTTDLSDIAPRTHDVRLIHGIGWRTIYALTDDTVTVNGRTERETYPREWIAETYRRRFPV